MNYFDLENENLDSVSSINENVEVEASSEEKKTKKVKEKKVKEKKVKEPKTKEVKESKELKEEEEREAKYGDKVLTCEEFDALSKAEKLSLPIKNYPVDKPILEIKDIDITFGRGKKKFRAVHDVSFNIYKGETVSLVGESGSGKTTIGRAIVSINPLSKGQIVYKGRAISGSDSKTKSDLSSHEKHELVRRIQMIFQDPAASLNERATIEYIIGEGLDNFRLYNSKQERMEKIENIITAVGLLPEHLTRYPHEFSGGQRQRVGIARSIVMEPEFIVCDEPISALDVSIRAQVLNLLKKFQKELGLTYLFIAHDLSIVRFISDRVVVIHLGEIVEIAKTEELFKHPLHPYTKSLMSAIPIPDPIIEKKKNLFIYDPSIHDYSVNKPHLEEIVKDHFVYGNDEEIEKYKKIRENQ